jgi:hypothetical protein
MGLVTNSNMQVDDFPGIWHCRYWFPSNSHTGEDVSEYYVRIEHAADGFVLHSLPNKLEAYIQAHFTTDTNLATGIWLEDTSPHGEFKSMVYSGVFQVIIAEDLKRMVGAWVGVGREVDHPEIYEGRWEIEYASETVDDLPQL